MSRTLTIELVNAGGCPLPMILDGAAVASSTITLTLADEYAYDPGDPNGLALPSQGFSQLRIPNVFPAVVAAGNPGLYGQNIALNSNFFHAFLDKYVLSTDADPTDRWVLPYDVTCRLYFKTFTLKSQHTDGVTDVPLDGRAVMMGASQFDWFGAPDPHVSQAAYDGSGGAWGFQLTDSAGVATYTALVGVSWQLVNRLTDAYYFSNGDPFVPDGGSWHTANPANHPSAGEQNIAMFPYVGESVSIANPYSQGNDPGGWQIDYSTAWDGSGNLTVSDPATAVLSYQQYGVVDVRDATNTPIPCTVTFGGYSGLSTDLSGDHPIAALPKGSLLDNVRGLWTAPQTDLPLLDASGYPASSPEDSPVHVVLPQYDGSYNIPSSYFYYPVYFTSKSGNTLQSISNHYGEASDPSFKAANFNGGEVVTQAYDVTATEIAAPHRVFSGKIWIHEDTTFYCTIRDSPPSASIGGGLDLCLDPMQESFLTRAQENTAGVFQGVGSDLESFFTLSTILSTTQMLCPSRQILADHLHLLAGIEAGAAKVWKSANTASYSLLATIDSANTYEGCALRLSPDGTVHCYLTTDAGSVKKRISTDGGATWEALTTPSGLPTCQAERIDVRHDGQRWLALCGLSSGALKVYSSVDDGDSWTEEATVAAAGRWPWLMTLWGGCCLTLYHDGSDIVSKRFGQNPDGTWSLGSAVSVATVELHGFAAMVLSQKVVVAFVNESNSLLLRKSFNQGDSYAAGSYG